VLLIFIQGARSFGGRLRLIASALLEMSFSILLAPIRMLFHTQFVVAAVTGWKLQWRSPARQDSETGWWDALRHHGLHTLLGLGWAGLVYWLNPAFLWWLLPVVGALTVSIPLSIFSSRVALGRRLRDAGFFVIPQESNPPRELRLLQRNLRHAPATAGFLDALVDPAMNALARAGIARARPASGDDAQRRERITSVLATGPAALDSKQRTALLRDEAMLHELHVRIRSSTEADSPWRALVAAHGKDTTWDEWTETGHVGIAGGAVASRANEAAALSAQRNPG
jgi:membrane glycosyltransferase